MNYPIGGNFSNIPMPPDSPYTVSWWYRKQFTVPGGVQGQDCLAEIRGHQFRANIWLNGKQIAKSDNVAGAWRTFEFNVTERCQARRRERARGTGPTRPAEHDLAITFVDWNPAPPDKNMGLWRDVYLTAGGPVALRYPTA